MAFFKITYERTEVTEFWVDADEADVARMIAEELDIPDNEWEELDWDVRVEPGEPQTGDRFWSGGETGGWGTI